MTLNDLYYLDIISIDTKTIRESQAIYIVKDGSNYRIRALSTVFSKLPHEPLTRAKSVWRINRDKFFTIINSNPDLVARLFPNNCLTNEPLTKNDRESCFGEELTENNVTPFNQVNQIIQDRYTNDSNSRLNRIPA